MSVVGDRVGGGYPDCRPGVSASPQQTLDIDTMLAHRLQHCSRMALTQYMFTQC